MFCSFRAFGIPRTSIETVDLKGLESVRAFCDCQGFEQRAFKWKEVIMASNRHAESTAMHPYCADSVLMCVVLLSKGVH